MQLIQPKLQNRAHQHPKTTSHASTPPSGKSAGFIPPTTGPVGFSSKPPLSRSACACASFSGKILASVSLFCEGYRSMEGCLFIVASLYGASSGPPLLSKVLSSATVDEAEEYDRDTIVKGYGFGTCRASNISCVGRGTLYGSSRCLSARSALHNTDFCDDILAATSPRK